MAMAKALPSTSDQLQLLSGSAFQLINRALGLEEKGDIQNAVAAYQEGLAYLDKALDMPIEDPLCSERAMAKNAKTRAKMSRTRQQVVFRLRELQNTHRDLPSAPPALDLSAPPPSYQEAMVDRAMDEIATYDEEACPLPSDADVLFTIGGRVQVFYINASGHVSTPSYPSTLHIFKFRGYSPSVDEESPAFLQVGTWVYPLIPGKSPVLQSTDGSYLFPDLDDSIEGNAIGLILPPDILDIEKKQFEGFLAQLTASTKEDLSEYEDYMEYSSQVSQGLVKGAEVVSRGMVKGAIKTSEWMHLGAEKLKDKIAPEDQLRHVDPKLQSGLEAAQWVSSKAVKVSGFLVSKAGTATVALARLLAPHIQRQSTRALSHIVGQSEEKSKKQIDIASELAGGSIEAFSTVYVALENSSKILAKNIASNTVKVVGHKYGSDVACATDNALSTVGNTCMTVYNAGVLGPKGMAKKVAKDAGKVLVGVPEEVILNRPKSNDNTTAELEASTNTGQLALEDKRSE